MTAAVIPAEKIVALHEALEAAMAYCVHNGPAPNPELWAQLNRSRAFVQVRLIDAMPALEIEVA